MQTIDSELIYLECVKTDDTLLGLPLYNSYTLFGSSPWMTEPIPGVFGCVTKRDRLISQFCLKKKREKNSACL